MKKLLFFLFSILLLQKGTAGTPPIPPITATYFARTNILLSTNAADFAARFGGRVSVTAFGAKGNGTNDDTAAVQSAIDTVQQRMSGFHTQSGEVYLPAGNYVISQPLLITNDSLVLCGSDTKSVWLYYTGTNYAIIIGKSATNEPIYNNVVRSLTIVVTNSNAGGININRGHYTQLDALHIEHYELTDALTYGVRVNGSGYFATGVEVRHSRIAYFYYGFALDGKAGTSQISTRCSVSNTSIDGSPTIRTNSIAIMFEQAWQCYARDCNIERWDQGCEFSGSSMQNSVSCRFENCWRNWTVASDARATWLVGNVIERNTGTDLSYDTSIWNPPPISYPGGPFAFSNHFGSQIIGPVGINTSLMYKQTLNTNRSVPLFTQGDNLQTWQISSLNDAGTCINFTTPHSSWQIGNQHALFDGTFQIWNPTNNLLMVRLDATNNVAHFSGIIEATNTVKSLVGFQTSTNAGITATNQVTDGAITNTVIIRGGIITHWGP